YLQLDSVSADDLAAASEMGQAVREQLASLPLPEDVSEEVLDAWHAAGAAAAYAVRSSATAEDLPSASFAGQQDTYLNVRGEGNILAQVKACFISLFTDRAILYRIQNGFEHRDVKLSVVVQQMVQPEVSGILFTADPVTGHREIISIDASFGLGEVLVAGMVTPDLYKVDKRDWTITECTVPEKQLAIWSLPDGGTKTEELAGEKRTAQVLDENQIIELAKIATRIEVHYGSPQDIEWAIADGEIFIVQSRPITSLYPVPHNYIESDAERVYFSLSHFQMMVEPMSPMGISVWRVMVPFGRENPLVGENPYITSAGGRFYADMSAMIYTRLGSKFIPKGLVMIDDLVGLAMGEFISRDTFAKNKARVLDKAKLHNVLHLMGPLAREAVMRLWFLPTEPVLEEMNTYVQRAIERTKATRVSNDLQTRVNAVYEHIQTVFSIEVFQILPLIIMIMSTSTLLKKLLEKDADPADLAAIQSGLEGNVTTEMDQKVGDLADIARENEAIVAAFEDNDTASLLSRIQQTPGSELFLAALDEFLQTYGLRGPGEIDVGRIRWLDDPTLLLLVMRGNLCNPEPGSHRKHYAGLIEKANDAIPRLIETARAAPMGWLRARVVRRLLTVFRSYMPIREHPKFMLVQFFQNLRVTMQDVATEFKKQGRIEDVEDIWYLTLAEAIEALEKSETEIRTRIEQRKMDYAYYAKLTPPRVITSNGEIIKAVHSMENMPEDAIPGSPVSAGVVEGLAKIVMDPASETLNPGEILVAPSTDPAWTPLFINAAGVVLEVGGLMTHGSVVAREYGIPAVVSVPDATKLIQTGQRIRVNGDAGYIEILD
ncbi:MAG: phosphoenolpyruvate synthase, partial [Anaerolineales bacterium]|nr:phosphoenolpyruvate synthase [Anaerolineales bacterium]